MTTVRKVDLRCIAPVTFASLARSVVFFAPRLWLMRRCARGSFRRDQAHALLQPGGQPLRRDLEPAMPLRLPPPLLCHAPRWPDKTPLALPWLGILAPVATCVAVLFRRRLDDWRFVAGGTLLFATTSAARVLAGTALFCRWFEEPFLAARPRPQR